MADRLDRSDPADKLIPDRMDAFKTEGSGYLAIQNSRPQTIGYDLSDSPLLRLAWIAEKVHERTDLPVDTDQLLTTVSLYWFTGSGASGRTRCASRRTCPTGMLRRRSRRASRFRRRPDSPQGGPRAARRALDRVCPRQALPGHGGPADLAADLRAFFGPPQ